MNKFFSDEDNAVEAFKEDGCNQNIFFGSVKDQIPLDPSQIEQIKPGEMARYVEEPKEEDKRKYSEPAKYIDPNEPKEVVYERPQQIQTPKIQPVQQQISQPIQNTVEEKKQETGLKSFFNKLFKK